MRTFNVFLLILLFGCETTPDQQELRSTPSAASSDLPPSKWPNNTLFPLTLHLGSDFTNDEKVALGQATQAWNETNSGKTQFFNTADSSFASRNNFNDFKDNEFGIYKIYDWPTDMPASALAVTQIYGTKTSSNLIKITHADVLLNYDYFDFSANDEWGYDLQTVVVHELGHFLGLYHENSSADQTVMYPTISRYRYNRKPHTHDEDLIGRKYNPVSGRSLLRDSSQEDTEEVIIIMELHKNKHIQRRIK